MKKNPYFISFRMSIFSSFVILLFLSAGLITFFSYFNALSSIDNTEKDLIEMASEQVITKTINHISPAMEMSFMISKTFYNEAQLLNYFSRFEDISINSMLTFPQLDAINFGFTNDNFYMIKREPDETFATKIIRRDVEKPYVEWRFRDLYGEIIKTEIHYSPDFFPTQRPWFTGAAQNKSYFMSDVYVFFTDKIPGVTCGYPVLEQNGTVAGVVSYDISLIGISRFLQTLKIGMTGKVFIINDKDEIIAHPNLDLVSTSLKEDETPSLKSINDNPDSIEYNIFSTYRKLENDLNQNGKKIKTNYKGVDILAYFFSFPKDFRQNWTVVVYVPENDFIGPIRKNLYINLILIGIVFIFALAVSYLFSSLITKPLNTASEELHRIKNFDLSYNFNPSSLVKEIYVFENDIFEMKKGLETFEKFLPEIILKKIADNSFITREISEVPELTVLFSEIENFSLLTKQY
ncbi:MAG TPA: hypothetical protein ENN73_00185, partial [Firmicutes bacterium]|nr:hypothetical protein [Bacillota bacterium]